jgi:glycosyltransferase involved in cell wall biosynthesis
MALAAPLLLARTLVVNSNAARQSLVSVLPALARRAHVVHNGVGGPPDEVPPAPASPVSRVTLVGRLAPRKGTDVAVEAIALLRREGRQVDLELCGTVFPGYEWFEKDLRSRSEQPDLSGAVHFAGYTSPTWPALARAAVVVVPSRAEPFGNTAVEAQLAGRPVVASAVQGLQEIVTSGTTGLLVPPGDPAALAAAIATVLDDPDLAARLARGGQRNAVREFSLDRYRAEMAAAVDRTATR